jgi:hypothetical protein
MFPAQALSGQVHSWAIRLTTLALSISPLICLETILNAANS